MPIWFNHGKYSQFVLSRKLTEQVRQDINACRKERGLNPLIFSGDSGFSYDKSMAEALCELCKELGYSVLAHYKGVKAGQSSTGVAVPAKCYYHHHGMPLPLSITGKPSSTKEADIVGRVNGEESAPLEEHREPRKESPKLDARKNGKWTSVLERLIALPIGESTTIRCASDIPLPRFLTQLRSISYSNKKTMDFRWSMTQNSQANGVVVTKVSKWSPTDTEEEDEAEEETIPKNKPLATNGNLAHSYEEVLAHLEDERSKLDLAIETIRKSFAAAK